MEKGLGEKRRPKGRGREKKKGYWDVCNRKAKAGSSFEEEKG